MTKIKIIYFASLRQATNIDQEEIETIAKTPDELFEQLQSRYQFKLPKNFIKVAVNEEYAAMNTLIHEGDTVVFIPPVAGG